ncbi:Nuclear transcription factor Y subunit B-7 [Raphanus sativus]|uniref:Nuclear transcription factor Y subunit B-7-like n=1 Tax=Raphanus sativus TaxID=3726 RepID=A0A6J0P4S9_RAPSA|nr:nuclear transcription factor Y subunit B-7-like [Raphanus sativus]KAJ4896950.1 Nuclear transcription factor Y subunit B-7 [Raphanus sativus]
MTEESPEEDHESPGVAETNLGSPSSKNNNNSNNKEQDRFLPIANVGRIMKKVLPGNGKISKDAKETVQECVSEFISFVTGEASDKCQREKRKTINGDDIIWAITTLGFEDYVAPLKVYLNKYRETEGEKANSPKQRQQQVQQNNHFQFQEQDHNNMSCTSYISHHHPSPFFPADHQPFPNLPFSPKSLQKQFPQQQQHDNTDSIGQWSV